MYSYARRALYRGSVRVFGLAPDLVLSWIFSLESSVAIFPTTVARMLLGLLPVLSLGLGLDPCHVVGGVRGGECVWCGRGCASVKASISFSSKNLSVCSAHWRKRSAMV